MITGIRLENFKALADSKMLQLKPITLLIGPNSSGKSSVLQALLAGRQTARAGVDAALVLSDGEDFELGTFPEVARQAVWPPWLALTFNIEFRASPPSTEARQLLIAGRRLLPDVHRVVCVLRAEFRYLRKVRETIVHSIQAEIQLETKGESRSLSILGSRVAAARSEKFMWSITEQGQLLPWAEGKTVLRRDRRFFALAGESELLLPGVASQGGTPGGSSTPLAISVFLRFLSKALQHDLMNIRHIGAMRVEPARLYPLKGTRPLDVGRGGQRAPDIIFSATRRKKSRDRLMRGLDSALQEMGISSAILARVPTGANAYVILLDHLKPKLRVNLAGVGFGVSQILPILVESYHAPPRSLILLEQPEIHLHPHAQSRIADLLADMATEGSHRKRFLVETHSEHLVRRLQVLVADPKHPLTRDHVQVYFFNPKEDATTVSALDMDDNGRFVSEWPEGFFDEALKLSVAHLEAIESATHQE